MKIHSIILNVCVVTSAGCLGAGYILGGYWLIMPIFLAMAIFWLIIKRRSLFWSASSLLLIDVALAIIGVTLNLSIYLMVVGCTAALACWDLTHFRYTIIENPPLATDARLERFRLQSLAIAVFMGMSLAFIGAFIKLQFSFGVMVFLVLVAVGCLTYGVQYLVRNR
jgi:hypothetical protein